MLDGVRGIGVLDGGVKHADDKWRNKITINLVSNRKQ